MPGFACVTQRVEDDGFFALPRRLLSPLIVESRVLPGSRVWHYVTNKFSQDKIFHEDQDFLVALEGVILNSRKLQEQSRAGGVFELVKHLYGTHGDEFFREFRGEFSGVLFDKRLEKWLIFTNHTGLKPVFYYFRNNLFACATDLPVLSHLLRSLGHGLALDIEGAYFLLTYGFMLDDYTLIREVKKLRAGHYLRVERGSCAVRSYHAFGSSLASVANRDETIEHLDELFRRAVASEYDKDRQGGYRHLAHLSGGLDSRIAVFAAREMGYDGILNMTFAQSNSLDDVTSKKIAADLGNEFIFYALDNGRFLETTLEDAIAANGGLVLYAGAAHELACYRYLNFDPYGLIHSGQIGDAVLGSFLSGPSVRKPDPFARAYSTYLIDRISSVARRIAEGYESEELFKFHNRGFNGAVNGNWMGNQFSDVVSPFLDLDFLQYALSIPSAMRFGAKLYEDWIARKYPRAARYVQTRTGLRIKADPITVAFRRLVRGLPRRLFGQRKTESMNPFEYWDRTNPALRTYCDKYFQDHIELLAGYSELKADCGELYTKGKVLEKTQVMSLLEAVRLHFGSAL